VDVDACMASISEIESRLADADRRRNLLHIELAKQEERLASVQETHRRFTVDDQQRCDQAEEAHRRLEVLIADRSRVTLHVLNTNAELNECLLEAERAEAAAIEFIREKQ